MTRFALCCIPVGLLAVVSTILGFGHTLGVALAVLSVVTIPTLLITLRVMHVRQQNAIRAYQAAAEAEANPKPAASMWGAEPLDRCPDPGNPGQEVLLWRSQDGQHHVIRVVDVASGNRIFIDVAPTSSALEAVASTFGQKADDYQPARAT